MEAIIDESNWKQAFESHLKFLNHIPCINNGGCAISAVAMYKWFKKHHLIEKLKVKLVYEYDWKQLYKTNDLYLKGKADEFTTCSHALISIKRKLYDSEGVYDRIIRFKHVISEEFALRTIFESCDWNPSFDRKNIKKINSYFDIKIEKPGAI